MQDLKIVKDDEVCCLFSLFEAARDPGAAEDRTGISSWILQQAQSKC